MAVTRPVLASLVLALAPAARAEVHKDPDLGFQVNTPRKWKKMPLAPGEQWIVAQYVSPREYWGKKEPYPHTPEMLVLLFLKGEAAEKKVDVKTEGDTTQVRVRTFYKDYKAYLKDHAQGGYFITKEEETTVNGLPATCLEIRFEKLTVPRRSLAWIFHEQEADWAVSFEALEDYWDSLSPEFLQCLRTFRALPRQGPLKRPGGDTAGAIDLPELSKKATPAERLKRRMELFDKQLKTAVDRLPKGWNVRKSKNYVALTHADDRYTQRLLEQAEAIRNWLEQNFAWVGDGKAGPALIRVCADQNEYQAFAVRSFWSSLSGPPEIITYRDVNEGMRSFAVQYFNRGVLGIWFRDKDQRLAWGMPGWLDQGFDQFLMTASAKGGRLEFRPDEWETRLLREAAQKGAIAKPADLMKSTWEEFSKTEAAWAQAGGFVRYLLAGPGARGPKTRDLLKSYLQNLSAIMKEEEEKEKAEGKKSDPKTEEEEEALFKERRQREKLRLEDVFRRTFASWSDGDWALFDRSYLEFVD